MEDILAIVLIFGGGTLAALSFSPVGRAVADRIRGNRAVHPDLLAEVEQLRQEMMDLDHVREEVVELQERVDFAERLLAQQREAGRLPGSGDA